MSDDGESARIAEAAQVALRHVDACNPIGDEASESVLWGHIGRTLFKRDPDAYRQVRKFALTFAALLDVNVKT